MSGKTMTQRQRQWERDGERDAVRTLGLREAARQRWIGEETREVEAAYVDLVRLVKTVLCVEDCPPPFILNEFESYADDRLRVCVEIEGLVFNLRPLTIEKGKPVPAYLILVHGACERCEIQPALSPIDDLADVGKYLESPAWDDTRRYCGTCERVVRAERSRRPKEET